MLQGGRTHHNDLVRFYTAFIPFGPPHPPFSRPTVRYPLASIYVYIYMGILTTSRDMYYEKWGFMLIFWNLAGVPLSYCHCTIYLANHNPVVYRWNRWALAAMYIAYLFWYWVWDSCNSQKNRFRAMERGKLVGRKTFPQVPWQTLHNPNTIQTPQGTILVDGWYGLARKIHYTADVWFAVSWALITGFEYVLFLFNLPSLAPLSTSK